VAIRPPDEKENAMTSFTHNGRSYGLGWLADRPDVRDYTPRSETVAPLLAKAKVPKKAPAKLASKVDLREWCSPIEDQETLGSCTAQAGVALMEYFQKKAFGEYLDGSRLFVYKTTRQLMGWTGDTGAFLRTTMGALALFGVPPESYWPYVIADFEEDPPAFVYALADNYEALQYYRLDPPGDSPATVLATVKTQLVGSIPSMFGFTVYSSLYDGENGDIPFPSTSESVVGGHAVVAVGYDDNHKITSPNNNKKTTGAFLIRNSWSTDWGDDGYGWLPYEYVLQGLADDWWTMISAEWVATGNFGE
jgi:C1A family cysteine protease